MTDHRWNDMLNARREVDAYSVIARDLLRERLGRLQSIGKTVKHVRKQIQDGSFAERHKF